MIEPGEPGPALMAPGDQGHLMVTDKARPILARRGPDEILPPPPPGVRYVRLPLYGLIVSDDELRLRIDRIFHWPMIILALLVLPLLAIEFLLTPAPKTVLWWGAVTAASLIWLAFLVEFVIKVTIAESRIEYVRRNWLDVIIILVPVLRPVRAARLARTTKVFTLRGVGMKFARYAFTLVIGLDATERFLERFGVKPAGHRKDPRSMTRYQLIDELKKLRRLTDAWEGWYADYEEYLKHIGVGHVQDRPEPPELEDQSLPGSEPPRPGRSESDRAPSSPFQRGASPADPCQGHR